MSISQILEQYTAQHSNFQTKRSYISMSHAMENDDILINQFLHGFTDSLEIRLKCYKGYQWEKDLLERMRGCFGQRVANAPELSAFDGLVKGHPDALFDELPMDCKTVPLDEHLPKEGRISKRIYWQLQAYMLYGNYPKALVIYESRETGHLADYWIYANKSIQQQIDAKFQKVAAQTATIIFPTTNN